MTPLLEKRRQIKSQFSHLLHIRSIKKGFEPMSYNKMNRYRFTESAIRHRATPDCQLLVQALYIYLLSATGQPRKEQQLPTCGTLDKQPSWRHKIMTKLLKYSLLDSFLLSGQFLDCLDSFLIVRTGSHRRGDLRVVQIS